VCANYKPFTPFPESKLIAQFDAARRRRKAYDALVPLSGGKDSTYILWLATKIYKLNVLAFTYDNGFLTDLARKNISKALAISGSDHILYSPDWDSMRRLYRAHLFRSGELCSVCAFGIVSSYTKIALMHSIPLVLTGNSLIEESSGTGEDDFDQMRFRAITKDDGVPDQEIKRMLIFPRLGLVGRRIYLRMRAKARAVSPLLYRPRISEAEMGSVVRSEMEWSGYEEKDHGKHLDCYAEGLSNKIRIQRYGFSRKDAQYSTLIRIGELDRDTALKMLEAPGGSEVESPESPVMKRLGLSNNDLHHVFEVPPYSYSEARSLEARFLRTIYNISSRNRALFSLARSIWRKL
jgi:hypothetical protein